MGPRHRRAGKALGRGIRRVGLNERSFQWGGRLARQVGEVMGGQGISIERTGAGYMGQKRERDGCVAAHGGSVAVRTKSACSIGGGPRSGAGASTKLDGILSALLELLFQLFDALSRSIELGLHCHRNCDFVEGFGQRFGQAITTT